MKVLLIYPPATIYGSGAITPHPPLGIAYLAAYLEEKGHQVMILDVLALGINRIVKKGKFTRYGLSPKDIKTQIVKFVPDIVGVSVMFTAFLNDAYEIVDMVKSIDRKILTVLGGAHISIDPNIILKNKNVDFAIKGEGEISLTKLLTIIDQKGDFSQVKGLSFRIGSKIIQNPASGFITNLDRLPFPARHLLPMDIYNNVKNPFIMRRPATTMITSRGCPGRCVYCSIHAIWGHTWRGRSPESVVDEIEFLVNSGYREVSFQDDSMSVNKGRLEKICDEIIKRKIDIKWSTPNGIAHWTLDKSLLRKMKKAGCYRITFGIESGNHDIRRWIGKPFSLQQAKELTRYANKIGFWTLATNIIGFPYETIQNISDTINYAVDSDVDFALFYRLGPRPGTPVYEVFKKEGWLPKNQWELFSESVACETKYIKSKQLFDIQHQAYLTFSRRRIISFLNPIRIIRKINSFEDLLYILKISSVGIKLISSLIQSKAEVTSKTLRDQYAKDR